MKNPGPPSRRFRDFFLRESIFLFPSYASAFSVNIPTGKKAGDYYVWFMAAGDSSHANSGKGVIKVTIKPASNPTPIPKPRKKVPRTGDDSMPGLWLGLVLLGTACISGVLVRTARKRK